jgi:hypothetical protein
MTNTETPDLSATRLDPKETPVSITEHLASGTFTDIDGTDLDLGTLARVVAWGGAVRLTDVGRVVEVKGLTPRGLVQVADLTDEHRADPVARGRSLDPKVLRVV